MRWCVYLDHAATTPLRPEAREAWLAAAETGRQRLIDPRRRAGRTPGARGRARAARRRAGLRPRRSRLHLGRHRVGQSRAQGLCRSRRETTGRTRSSLPDGEHHATLDTRRLAARARGRRRRVGARRRATRSHRSAGVVGRGRLRRMPPLATALVANNEVGTLNDRRRARGRCVEAGVPLHLDAVARIRPRPAVVPRRCASRSGSRSAGLVALSVAGAQARADRSASAPSSSRARRVSSRCCTAAVSSAACARARRTSPGAAAFAVAAELAVAELESGGRAPRGPARSPRDAACASAFPRCGAARRPAADRLPATSMLLFPGAQGDSCCCCWTSAGIAVSTGSACQAGVPEPSHVVLRDGAERA